MNTIYNTYKASEEKFNKLCFLLMKQMVLNANTGILKRLDIIKWTRKHLSISSLQKKSNPSTAHPQKIKNRLK